jgi:hypothetical protein
MDDKETGGRLDGNSLGRPPASFAPYFYKNTTADE